MGGAKKRHQTTISDHVQTEKRDSHTTRRPHQISSHAGLPENDYALTKDANRREKSAAMGVCIGEGKMSRVFQGPT